MNNIFFIVICLFFTQDIFAAGGFEKPVLWSARAARQGGAYAANVKGSEAILFNPAGLIQERDDLTLAFSSTAGETTAPLIENDREKSMSANPLLAPGILYSKQLDSQNAVGFGVYGVGGLAAKFTSVDMGSLGNEFERYRPHVFGELSIIELGVSYARKLSEKLSAGLTLKAQQATGGFGQVQVSRAKNLSDNGIADGTVLAASNVEFKNLSGYSLGSFSAGFQYQLTQQLGVALVYRSASNFDLKSDGSGRVVYSNTGAAATGATAGKEYKLSTSQTTISSSLPQSVTGSAFYKLTDKQTTFFEYTLTNYAENRKLDISGDLKNPVDKSKSRLADTKLRWHNMHDLKFGWTTAFKETWDAGLGYSLTLPVTDKRYAGATFAAPANYHHFYTGLGKAFKKFRVDGAAEYYFSRGKGKTQELDGSTQNSPSVKGSYETEAFAFFVSGTIPL